MTKLVVYFDLPDEHIKQLSNISENMAIVRCTEKKEFLAHIADTEILITLFKWPDAKTVQQAPRLKWIQSLTAGVDFLPLDEIRARGIILTSGRGIHKIYIAEYALAAMISFARNSHIMLRNQLQKKWDRSVPQAEICGSVVGILGLGSIGQEIALKASLFGMRVIGVKNHPLPIECVDHVYGPSEMGEVFKQSDYVINLLPDTADTRGVIDNTFFNMMKTPACFINLGRGRTVNQADLIGALQSDRIRGFVGDVFEEEPLPEDSPLWKMDNVVLTPHIAGASPKYIERAMEIVRVNLSAYINQTGKMINVVDVERGY